MIKFDGDFRRAILYFFLYCPLGIISPLIGQYLSSIGFSGTQVGIVTSLGTGVAIVAGLLWGKVYANSYRKRLVLAIMCVVSATLGVISTSTTVFLVYAALYSVLYFFQGPLHGLADAFVISKSNNFSGIRAMGAAGYAIAVFVAGEYAERFGLKGIFYMYAITFVIAAVFIMLESEPPYHKEVEKKVSISEVFKNSQFIKLLICSFFLMGTNIANSTYFGYLFRQEGGSVAGIGLAFLLMAGSEAPFMAMTPKLSKKLGSEKLILFAMALTALRFGFYATGPSHTVLLGTFFLQGITNGIILVELVKAFGGIVEERLSSMAISVYYAIGNSLSVILCNLICGVILDIAGPQGVYLFCFGFNTIAVILYIILGMYKNENKTKIIIDNDAKE